MPKASTTTSEWGEGVRQGFILSPGTAERSSGLQQYSGEGIELPSTYEGEDLVLLSFQLCLNEERVQMT